MSERRSRSAGARDTAAATGLTSVSDTETVHHESRSKRHRPIGRMGELNLTSMLDVIFLLLIFFVLTASFALGEGILPADMPRGESESESDELPPTQPIEITLRSLGGYDVSIQLAGDPSPPETFNELYQKLSGLQRTEADPGRPFGADDPVIIRADSEVRWAHMVSAFNAAVRARYTNINFAQPTE